MPQLSDNENLRAKQIRMKALDAAVHMLTAQADFLPRDVIDWAHAFESYITSGVAAEEEA